MIEELLRRWVYGVGVQWWRARTGVRVHYRVQYGHDYLTGARWYALRTLRLMVDGHQCTHRVNLRRCSETTRLQVHHTTYQHKGASGVHGFLLELGSLRTLCDYHHDKDTRG